MNLTKNEIKRYSSLLQKKFRNAENKFLVEGKKLIGEVIDSGYTVEKLIVTNEFFEEERKLLSELIRWQLDVALVNSKEFEKLSDTVNPQGICAVVLMPTEKPEFNAESDLVVALESVNDPGNLGTIIRTCDWFGIKNILLNEDCADIYNPKVLRASMGSVFHTSIAEGKDFIITLKLLKEMGFTIVCADILGDSIYSKKRPAKSVIVFSNEANGPSEELLNIADRIITIPPLGYAESLNVASAAAVIISEFTKSHR